MMQIKSLYGRRLAIMSPTALSRIDRIIRTLVVVAIVLSATAFQFPPAVAQASASVAPHVNRTIQSLRSDQANHLTAALHGNAASNSSGAPVVPSVRPDVPVTRAQHELVYLPIKYKPWAETTSKLPAAIVSPQQASQAIAANGPMVIENVGQFDPQAKFLVHGGNGSMYLTEDGLWLTVLEHPQDSQTDTLRLGSKHIPDKDLIIKGVNLKLSFPGANPHPRLEPFNRLDTHVSYFIGNDPTQWHADVPVWGGVRYIDLYPGIDLEFTGESGQLQRRLIVHNEAKLANMRLRVEGAEILALDSADHSLVRFTTTIGDFAFPLFQVEGLSSNTNLPNMNIMGNEIAAPFVPVLKRAPGLQSLPIQKLSSTLAFTNTSDLFFSTYLGGSGNDTGYGISIDTNGAAYIVGTTSSTNFTTTTGAFSTTLSGMNDAFVTKIAPDGSSLIYSTYLGGIGNDIGQSIAVDSNGSAYVTGYTSSTFPISGALPSMSVYRGGPFDGFVTKLNPNGNALVYSTYLGGADYDTGAGIAINGSGEAYIVGSTTSATTFPVVNAYQPDFRGYRDAFVTKINAAGSGMLYSTYLGGSSNPYTTSVQTSGYDVVVDSAGAAYVTGETNSSNFPTTLGAFQTSWGGGSCLGVFVSSGCPDAFVTKINSSGSLNYSTFLGGGLVDRGYSIAVDKSGAAYVTGETSSSDFPLTQGAFQTTRGSLSCFEDVYCPDAFTTKLEPSGNSLQFSTFLGGDWYDYGYGIAIDKDNNVYIAGETSSFNGFPISSAALQTSLTAAPSAFVTVFNMGGGLEYSTFLGGATGSTSGYGTAMMQSGVAYITGKTNSTTGFPILQAFQPSNGGADDAFITKLGISSVISKSAWTRSCPLCALYNTQHNIAGPINTTSGNYTYQKVDETIPVLAGSLAFERSYIGEARSLYTRTLGYGWTHNQEIRLVFPTDPGGVAGQVQLQAPGGSQLPFFDLGNGSYQAYPGVTASMSRITATGGITTYVVTATNQTVYTFNASGLVTQTVNPAGNVITYTYYPTGSLQSVQSYGRSLRFSYDTQNRLKQVLDLINRSTQFGYDANGDLAVITDTRGLVWTYQYSGTTHLLMRIIDPDQKTVERTDYDGQGRAIRQYNGKDELVVQFQFGSGGVITVTDGLTRNSIDRYGRGTWLGGSDTASQSITRTYDANFKPTYIADPNGNGPQMKWSANGSNLERVTDARGFTTTMQYDGLNNLKQITDTRGFSTTFTYSGSLLTRQTDALSNTTIYTYGQSNLLIAQQDALGRVTRYGYDIFGERTVITDALGNVTRFQYDAVGRLITTTDPLNQITVNSYDSADHLIAVTNNYTSTSSQQNYLDTYNLITRYGYDGFGRQILVTDTLNHVTRNGYDAAGRLVSTTVNYSPTVGQNYQSVYNLITRYGYDAAGNRILMTDTLGFVTRTDYDTLNRPVTVTTNYKDGVFDPAKPDEDVIRITGYDPAGNVITQTDPLGRITRNWYDALNRVISTSVNYTSTTGQPNYLNTYNLVTAYGYDEADNQILITDTLNHVTRNYYDPLGRLISTTVNYSPTMGVNAQNQYNVITRYGYDKVGNRLVVTDPLTNTARYAYDSLNRVLTTTDALAGTMITAYDAAGNRLKTTDALTHTTIYTYNPAGQLTAQADAANTVTRYQYDALGRTIVVTDPLTHTNRTFYDDTGRVVSTTNALTGTTVITYDALGRKVGFINENGKSSTTGYDGLGRTIAMTDATGSVTQYGYDAVGNRVKVIDGLLHTTVYTYDAANRLIVQSDALANTTRYGYDGLGNRTVMTDANGIATRYDYDALNRLAVVTESFTTTAGLDPNKYNLATRYGYDAIGNRTVMTNARGYTTTYGYDALYRLTTLTDPLTHTTQYMYDAVGNRTRTIDANGAPITYTYDVVNRNTRIDYGTNNVQYAYDPVGNRTAMTDSIGVTRYVYDELNRLKTTTDPYNQIITNTYDAVGNRTKLTYPDGKVVTYTYDAANRLLNVTDWTGQNTAYGYDAAGRLVTTTLPNGLQTANAYDNANRVTRLTHSRASTLVEDYQYALDAVGNRTVVTETMPSPGGSGGGSLSLPMGMLDTLTSSSGRRRPGRIEQVPPELLQERPPRALDPEDLLTPTPTPTPRPTLTSVRSSTSELRPISWQPDLAPMRLKTAHTTTARTTALQQGSGNFPSTLVIDNFNRPDGPLGRLWFSHTSGYTITNQQLGYVSGHSIYWNAWFGPTQEEFVTVATVDSSSTAELDLFLKVQGVYYGQGAIIVSYMPSTHVAGVYTTLLYDNVWLQQGNDISVTLQNNDVFGARARADGTVEVYQNGTLLASVDASSWPFYATAGRVGLAVYDAPAMRLDDFGAGGVSDAVNLAPLGGVWKYLDNGTDQGTAWRTPGFDDSSWQSGTAQLGYGDGDETTVVGYGSDPNNKYITTYFRRTFTVSDPAQYQALLLRLQRDDGAVVYLNGSEVFRSNLPGGTITYTTRAASDVGGDAEIHFYTATVPITALVSGANLIAVEVHQQAATSSDLSFDLELVGTPLADTLIPKGASWKYLDNGSDQGTTWRSPTFNDATWSTGAAELGYGDGDEATVVSYGPDPNNKYITTYFRKAFTVTNPAGYQHLWLQLLADDGALVYVNGTEAARVNLASGAVTYATRAIEALNEPEETRFNLFYLAPSLLVSGTNVVAVEVHQQITNTSDCSFDLILLGQTGIATTTINYTYDPLYRLTNANYSGAYTYTFAYAYDQVGNRTAQTQTITNTQVTTYTYNVANQLVTAKVNNESTVWYYTYDANGNLREMTPNGSNPGNGAIRYTYDTANHLNKVETHNGTSYSVLAQMAYDGLGNRARLTTWAGGVPLTTTFANSSDSRILQATTGTTTTRYLYGKEAIAEFGGQASYYLVDGYGSLRQTTDASGNVVFARWYDPFGQIINQTGSGDALYGYLGAQFDRISGLLYINGAYYDPATGRFLTPSTGGSNPYVPLSGLSLAPFIIIAVLCRRKKGQIWTGWLVLAVMGAVALGVAACREQPGPGPSPSPRPPTVPPSPSPSPSPNPSSTPTGKTAYLTFDDGPDPSATPQIALYLQQRGVQATFFLVGTGPGWPRIESACIPNLNGPDVVPLPEGTGVVSILHQRGFAIGIHAWTHTNMWNDPNVNPASEVSQVENSLRKILGVTDLPDKLLRAPGGAFPNTPITGYENWYYYGWDVDAFDESGVSPQTIVDNVINKLKQDKPQNPIILLHSIQLGTLEAITNPKYDLIGKIIEQGYQFGKLPRPADHTGYPPNGDIYTIG